MVRRKAKLQSASGATPAFRAPTYGAKFRVSASDIRYSIFVIPSSAFLPSKFDIHHSSFRSPSAAKTAHGSQKLRTERKNRPRRRKSPHGEQNLAGSRRPGLRRNRPAGEIGSRGECGHPQCRRQINSCHSGPSRRRCESARTAPTRDSPAIHIGACGFQELFPEPRKKPFPSFARISSCSKNFLFP